MDCFPSQIGKFPSFLIANVLIVPKNQRPEQIERILDIYRYRLNRLVQTKQVLRLKVKGQVFQSWNDPI